MKPYKSDMKRKTDLKKRLYDSGISYYPMPSVVRPIEANSGVKSFMANTNVARGNKAKDKRNKYMHDMSADFAMDGAIPSMKGNMTMDYDPREMSGAGVNNSMISKGYRDSANYGDISYQQDRIQKAMRGGYSSFNQSITGIKTASELKPALQVKQSTLLLGKGPGRGSSALKNQLPPVERNSKQRQDIQESPNKSMQMYQDPYAYEEFKYTSSIGQLSKPAKDKIFSCPNDWKKRKVEITTIKANQEDFGDEFDRAMPSSGKQGDERKDFADLKQVQNAVNNKEWVDLDKYIELLLDSKSEDEIVFIYCNPNPNGDPYDLQVCSFDQKNEDKYYTMSGKGLSCHEGDHVTEFISLAQWLINRDSYNHIKELRFFKKFKKWKFMRMWKDTIKQEARKQASTKLKEKLFILHDTFKSHLLTHRDYCKKMEELRFVDLGSNIETQTIKEFTKNQVKARSDTNKRISQFSAK